DAGVSLGVVVAGLLINITGLQWIDPITSFLIIAVILWGTWNLFTDSVDLALDAVPKQIDVDKVRDFLLSQNGVQNVHDLHIWAMSTTKVALSVHIITSVQTDSSFIQEIQESLHEKFNIGHTTIQIEFGTVLKDCCTNCN
ncbi:MAG: cation transporter, partial [Bacteroidia bacterium]|nr:cation transporter [Bacteroidia bacterium]